MSDGVPVDSAVPATPVEAQMDAATPVEATMTTAAEGADEGTAEESNDVHAEEVAVVNDDGTPSEPAAASDPSDAAPAATAVPAGPPGPPPGAPPVGGNGIPPGPPPGAPNSQQSYAAPVMRFGAYTAPPMYPPPIQPNFPPTIPPFMPGGPMMMPNFPPPLPPGWSEHTAPDGLTKYYYNSQTRESTYSRPSFAPLPNGMPPPINNAQAAIPEKKKKKEKPKEKVAIPGTGWQRITTSEGNVFYFEKETKRSEWSVPDEIKEEVAELEADEKRLKDEALKQEKEKREADRLERLREQERVRAEIEEERKKKLAFIAAKRKAAAEAQEGESKRPKTEPAVQDEGTEAAQDPDERQDEDEDEAYGPQDEEDEEEWMKAVAAEFAQADQEKQEQEEKARQATQLNTEEAAKQIFAVPQKVNVSLEEQRALFKALLMEKDISPFAPWDQSLPLFINDPRYILLASEKDRREVYEDYCRDVGRARRLKKTSATTSAAETKKADPEKGYKALLREDVTSTRTRWDDFRRKWKKDRRFYAFGRDDREREKVFKTHLKELGERKRADAQRAELDFYELLREQSNLSSSSVWAEVKKSISSDTRYDAVGSSTLRAELFEGFIRKLASSSATANETPEQIAERKLAERKAKQEASLRERQAKVGAEKERVEREVGKSKAGAGREDGERIFGSLLVDQIRDHEVAWNDASRFLSTDPRFNHPSLMLGDKRRLFEQHISRISAKRSNALHDLFAANTPQLDTPYDEVYPKIIEDPIVQRAGLDVHSLEDRWNTWKRHRETEARTEFNQMLGENSFVDFWGKMRKKQTDEAAAKVMKDQEDEEDAEEEQDRDLSELAQQIDLKEVKAVLRRDKRYRQFDHIPEEREQWIKEYLDGLEAASGSKTVHNVGGGR